MSELPLRNPEVLAAGGVDELVPVAVLPPPAGEPSPHRHDDDLERFGFQASIASP